MIEFTTLGKTSIRISRLAIGSWQASGWSSSNKSNFIAAIQKALSLGINFIDTAESYGDGLAETYLAEALQGSDRTKIVLASKFSHTNSNPQKLRNCLEQTLSRLNTEYLDLYQQHWPPKSPPLDETILELEKLKQEGKIRAIGVSNWMEPEWEECSLIDSIDCLQPCYSLLWRAIEKNVLPLCRNNSISIIPYSPLCQGLLTGRFRSSADVPKDSRRQNVLFAEANFTKLAPLFSLLSELSIKYQTSFSAIALRWLLDQPGVSAPIVGASKPEHIEQVLGAFDLQMERHDTERLSLESNLVQLSVGPHESMWRWHPRMKKK